jgi:hypothetical protein
MKEIAQTLIGDILGVARVDEEDIPKLEELVYRALERTQRVALTAAVTECERAAMANPNPGVRVPMQQMAIRIAKLALSHPQLVPMKGAPRKVGAP